MDRGETLFPIDTRPFFGSIFLKLDAYHVLAPGRSARLGGLALTENNWRDVEVVQDRVD